MIRPIPAATEYRLRSADEMAELIHTAVETYHDAELLSAGPCNIYVAVAADAALIAARSERDRELAAAGIL